jgi:chromosome segregation ATPase
MTNDPDIHELNIRIYERDQRIEKLTNRLAAAEKMSETRRVMLVDSYENVTKLCKERDELKLKIFDLESEYKYEKCGHSHMQGLVTKANNRYDKLQIEKDRYQSLFEEEKESNLNNVMCYTQQIKDLSETIAGLRHELKYRKPKDDIYDNG